MQKNGIGFDPTPTFIIEPEKREPPLLQNLQTVITGAFIRNEYMKRGLFFRGREGVEQQRDQHDHTNDQKYAHHANEKNGQRVHPGI